MKSGPPPPDQHQARASTPPKGAGPRKFDQLKPPQATWPNTRRLPFWVGGIFSASASVFKRCDRLSWQAGLAVEASLYSLFTRNSDTDHVRQCDGKGNPILDVRTNVFRRREDDDTIDLVKCFDADSLGLEIEED